MIASAPTEGDAGVAVVGALAMAVALMAGLLAVAALAQGVLAHTRAGHAADLSAHAAAVAVSVFDPDPCAVANGLAERLGARMQRCEVTHPGQGPTVDVTVEVPIRVLGIGRSAEGRARSGLRLQQAGR